MNTLAIDTSTGFLSIGVSKHGRNYEYCLEVGRKLSKVILPTIQDVLSSAGVSLKDISLFSVGLGPGSFTGIRIGISVIRGLAYSQGKREIGLPTLDILAQAVKAPDIKHIVPVIDAKRGLFYCCVYNNKHKKITPYMLLSPQELIKKIPSEAALLGDGIPLLKDILLKQGKAVRILDKDFWRPQAHSMLELCLKNAGKKARREPIYLYPKECQIKTQN